MTATRPESRSLDALLRGVSRSFYLSIRLLPGSLRAPVGTAYLLARATDTVADSAFAPADERRELLARMSHAIADTQADSQLVSDLSRFSQSQPNDREAELLLRLPEALEALGRLSSGDREVVQTVLGHIVQGQDLDIERFPDAGEVRALPDASALETYTYLVAGCVGEFWTDICARHLEPFADREVWQLRALGRSFGCGLQLVNIVRDVGEDLAAGRCYLPASELEAAGVSPQEILAAPERLMPVWQRWQDEAMARLADGITYAQAVESRRVRAAVALPALLGRDTLVRLRAAGLSALATRTKVSRREVRNLMFRMALGLASRGTVQSEWDNRGR